MKAKTLTGVCKLASRISNPSSLTSLYRSIEIGPDTIRCCSEFGNLEILCESSGLKDTILLNTDAITSVVSNLPQDEEIVFDQKLQKVDWSCENSKGHLNLVQTDHVVPKITHQNFPWVPSADLGNALVLASSACQAAAVSIGMYGIVLEPEGEELHILSCNSISLASSTIEKGSFPAGKVTIRPPVPGIIASLLAACPNCTLDITDQGIFILGDWLMAHLPLGSNLDHDLKLLANKYQTEKEVVKINSAAVKKFIARAKGLTDKKSSFDISLKVEEGKLVLMHSGISSSQEQWFLAEGINPTTAYQSKSFAAEMIVTPLEFVQNIVLDYLPDAKLVLKGVDPKFLYAIGGS